MLHNFSVLPIELQASVVELRAAGVGDDAIDTLIGRIFSALEAKTNRVQADVFNIEEHWDARFTAGFEKLAQDLRTQNGASNQMLMDIHNAVQLQGAAVTALRAEFLPIGERLSEVEGKVAEHDQSRDRSIEERRLLRKDMDESKEHRRHLQQTLDTALPAITQAIAALDARHGQQIAELAQELHEIKELLALTGADEASS